MKKYLPLVALMLSVSTSAHAVDASVNTSTSVSTPRSIIHDRNVELKQNNNARLGDQRDNRIGLKTDLSADGLTPEQRKAAVQDYRQDKRAINQQYNQSGKEIRQDFRGDVKAYNEAHPNAPRGTFDRIEDRADRREDRFDRREDRRDRREDVRDAREDRWDATHGNNGPRDRAEDRRDRREDKFDRREDRRDVREDIRDRREDRFDRNHGPDRGRGKGLALGRRGSR